MGKREWLPRKILEVATIDENGYFRIVFKGIEDKGKPLIALFVKR